MGDPRSYARIEGRGHTVAEERSERMALVRSRDTKPEMTVRRLVHQKWELLAAAEVEGGTDVE